jgi:hypothetical protein
MCVRVAVVAVCLLDCVFSVMVEVHLIILCISLIDTSSLMAMD